MFSFIVRRLLQFIPTFLLATVLLFLIVQAAPGDFLTQLSQNPRITPERLDQLRTIYHLDQPLFVQYWSWLTNFVQGNLGDSFAANQPVWELAKPRILNSLILVGISTVLIYAVGLLIGVYGALKPYSLMDKVTSVLAYFGLGIPSFFFGLLVIFGLVTLKQTLRKTTGHDWDIPIIGKSSVSMTATSGFAYAWNVFLHALAPSIVLALRSISSESRYIRAQMLEVLGQDYIRTARAKGLAPNTVTYKHAFKNAAIPLVAGLGGILPALIGGAGFIEVVFAWPGITPMLLDALGNQDLYVVVSITALSTLLYIIGNVLSDIILAAIDPRVRFS